MIVKNTPVYFSLALLEKFSKPRFLTINAARRMPGFDVVRSAASGGFNMSIDLKHAIVKRIWLMRTTSIVSGKRKVCSGGPLVVYVSAISVSAISFSQMNKCTDSNVINPNFHISTENLMRFYALVRLFLRNSTCD